MPVSAKILRFPPSDSPLPDDDESSNTTSRYLSHHQGVGRGARTRARASFSELRLARWLQEHLGFAGSEVFVQTYGAAAILRQLHDGVISWVKPDMIQRRGGVKPGWKVRAGLRCPAGFLSWLVKQASS